MDESTNFVFKCVVFFLFARVNKVDGYSYCDPFHHAKVLNCACGFMDYIDVYVPLIEESREPLLCKRYKDFKSCTGEVNPICRTSVVGHLERLYDVLCNSDFKGPCQFDFAVDLSYCPQKPLCEGLECFVSHGSKASLLPEACPSSKLFLKSDSGPEGSEIPFTNVAEFQCSDGELSLKFSDGIAISKISFISCARDNNETNSVEDSGEEIPDITGPCPPGSRESASGDCRCSMLEPDSDGDGSPDCSDMCPLDPQKTNPGICGCGNTDADSDYDGIPDCSDNCPEDSGKSEAGECGCGKEDGDEDEDGIPDCKDRCPHDPFKADPGECGCGIPDGDGPFECYACCVQVSAADLEKNLISTNSTQFACFNRGLADSPLCCYSKNDIIALHQDVCTTGDRGQIRFKSIHRNEVLCNSIDSENDGIPQQFVTGGYIEHELVCDGVNIRDHS